MTGEPRSYGKIKCQPEGFRKGTTFTKIRRHFLVSPGGIGDHLCLIPAFRYISQKMPHIMSKFWFPDPMVDFARVAMKDCPGSIIAGGTSGRFDFNQGDMVTDPEHWVLYTNPLGAHLVDLGFMIYLNLSRAPEGFGSFPDLSLARLPGNLLKRPDKPYAVVTAGFTWETRRMRGSYFNQIVSYIKDLGLTPVFLGKRVLGQLGAYKAGFDDDADFSQGIDLRDETNLVQAFDLIRGAEFILGIDGGLLHLAGFCDTPIIFGHTITRAEHRTVRREKGRVIDIEIPESVLACSGCQSRMRMVKDQEFNVCFYDDYRCLDLLFRDDCVEWKNAIDSILNERRKE